MKHWKRYRRQEAIKMNLATSIQRLTAAGKNKLYPSPRILSKRILIGVFP